MPSKLIRTAVAAACCVVGHAQAAIFTFTGDTSGGPTYNRPLEDLSALSEVGTAVPYETLLFTVSTAGEYTFLTTGAFDTFLTLYSGSFAPAASLSNAVIANDDLLGVTTSGFASTLGAGTTYVLVHTGFDNSEFGAFSTTVGGPGLVAVVPEPAAYVLLLLGAAALAAWRRGVPGATG